MNALLSQNRMLYSSAESVARIWIYSMVEEAAVIAAAALYLSIEA